VRRAQPEQRELRVAEIRAARRIGPHAVDLIRHEEIEALGRLLARDVRQPERVEHHQTHAVPVRALELS
jgi:hypothetical protein